MSGVYDVKPYARTVLTGLGYKEHRDPFNKANIPANLIEKAFHLDQEAAQGVKNNQDNLEMNVPLRINLHKKGFRRVNDKFQEALADAETVRDAMLAPQTRLTQPYIKNVKLQSMEVTPLSESNDHAMLISFVFTFLVLVSTRRQA